MNDETNKIPDIKASMMAGAATVIVLIICILYYAMHFFFFLGFFAFLELVLGYGEVVIRGPLIKLSAFMGLMTALLGGLSWYLESIADKK